MGSRPPRPQAQHASTPGHPSPPSIPTPPSIETPPACLPLELPSFRSSGFFDQRELFTPVWLQLPLLLLLHSHLSHSLEQSSTFSSSSFCPISCHNLSLSLPTLNFNFIVVAHLSLCAVVSLYHFPRRPSSTLDFELQPVAITVALLRLIIGIALV